VATAMKVIDRGVLDSISAAARLAPRLRKNHNLHPDNQSACHRLFNAVEPGSYIRPHRHLDPEKDETFLIVRGSLGVVVFDEEGKMTGSVVLSAGGDQVAADVPHGAYHAAVSLQSGTIFFEAKAGPYLPLCADEWADFAPEEGSPEAPAYLLRLEGLFA
jgi:cupin fold WbuC family metalloprotein